MKYVLCCPNEACELHGVAFILFALFFLPRFFGGKNIIVAVQTDV